MSAQTTNPLSILKTHLRAACAAAALLLAAGSAQAADLNALIWCDHADPALLQPFEEANGVKVNVKEFEGTGAGLAIVEQSQPGDWDVMVIDSHRRAARRRKGPVRAIAGGQTALRRPVPAGEDGRLDRRRRQALRHHRKIRLQHDRLQQDQGRSGRHAVAGRADRRQIQGPHRHLRLLSAGHRHGGAWPSARRRRS